jgi:hypothetical protein
LAFLSASVSVCPLSHPTFFTPESAPATPTLRSSWPHRTSATNNPNTTAPIHARPCVMTASPRPAPSPLVPLPQRFQYGGAATPTLTVLQLSRSEESVPRFRLARVRPGPLASAACRANCMPRCPRGAEVAGGRGVALVGGAGMRYDAAAGSAVFSQCQPFSAASSSDVGHPQCPRQAPPRRCPWLVPARRSRPIPFIG